ncbi:MAG: histidine kinase [Cyclobacteriaceae bacterium]
MEKENYIEAEIKFKERLTLPEGSTSLSDQSTNYELLSNVFEKTDRLDSSLIYATQSLDIALETGIYTRIIEANLLLSRLYEKKDKFMALKYSKAANVFKAQLDSIRIKTSVETFIASNERERLLEVDRNQVVYENNIQRLWIFTISIVLLSVLIIGMIFYRNHRNRKKANLVLEKKNLEVGRALEQLKSTQNQLIHSEKMASLGELTAGIAHEIQNPLNFVNNFSEVNKELAEEIKEELDKGDIDEAKSIANDLIENEDKVNHHGKRAEGIVKSMLQHSRTGSGEKELTDINALCDEYLRLAYHGFRAKDKSFNSEFKLELDESLPKISVVPQDMGRVLLNLINNAFQAVSENPSHPEPVEGDEGTMTSDVNYSPTVQLKTQKLENSIQITVSDNGPGIPEHVRDKIFEPFFTTKPTGEGTGLGLSMSYDIVTKGHGGMIEVESGIETGTKFIVEIPKTSAI